jgi:hypothetical protein
MEQNYTYNKNWENNNCFRIDSNTSRELAYTKKNIYLIYNHFAV